MFWENSSRQMRMRIGARLSDWKNRCAAWSAVVPHRIRGRHPRAGVGVITYHRVMPVAAKFGRVPLCVTPRKFASQLANLLSTGHRPMAIGELVRRYSDGCLPNCPTFSVAFDDSFESVYRFAFPILKDLHIPATVFVPTKYIGSDEKLPFDPWTLAGDAAVPTWSWRSATHHQLCEMLDSGLIEIASHSHSHAKFADAEDFRCDIRDSRLLLSESYGINRPHFSFPFGAATAEMRRCVREVGMTCAFTTNCGNVHHSSDQYAFSRFGAEEWDSELTLAAKIDGWFEQLRQAWRRPRLALKLPSWQPPQPARS